MKKRSDIGILETKIDYISSEIQEVKNTVNKLEGSINAGFVRKEEFDPVKKIAYGLVAIIMTLVITALVYLVVQR